MTFNKIAKGFGLNIAAMRDFLNLSRHEKKHYHKEIAEFKRRFYFKKMLEDKNAIHQHLHKRGKLADIKNKYRFVKPLSTSGS